MDPFNEFDLRSFKIIEILGTSSEIKKHCIGWLISAKKGYKIMMNNFKGNFYTHRPIKDKPTSWGFENGQIKLNGEAILLKDGKIWHPYQTKIKSHEVNMVLFTGLSSKLSRITNNADLLKASSGFFRIGSGCYGGRINKV